MLSYRQFINFPFLGALHTLRGVDYAGDVSPSLFIKSKFVPRTFSLDSCVLDMLRF